MNPNIERCSSTIPLRIVEAIPKIGLRVEKTEMYHRPETLDFHNVLPLVLLEQSIQKKR